MKKSLLLLLVCLLLSACTPGGAPADTTLPAREPIGTTSPPSPTEVTTVTVFSPNENLDGYIRTELSAPYLTIVEALVRMEVLPAGVQVNEISWNLEERSIHVDFNAAFRDLICSQGTTGELMVMGSVVNTFLTANDAETMTITVDGAILESGHVIYDFPMDFYE